MSKKVIYEVGGLFGDTATECNYYGDITRLLASGMPKEIYCDHLTIERYHGRRKPRVVATASMAMHRKITIGSSEYMAAVASLHLLVDTNYTTVSTIRGHLRRVKGLLGNALLGPQIPTEALGWHLESMAHLLELEL